MTTADSPARTRPFLATRRGKLMLALLCAVAFLDFVDASIVNVALPSIRHDLDFSVQGLQWVPSGYLLTYGGFMLLGGRAADLLGRRRVLVAGTVAVRHLVAGRRPRRRRGRAGRRAPRAGPRRGDDAARRAVDPDDDVRGGHATATRRSASGAASAGLASAAGVLLGGVLTEGPGWRWVLFVNPPVVRARARRDLPADRRRPARGAARRLRRASAPCSPPAGCCCSSSRS